MRPAPFSALLIGTLALGLSACTVTVRPGTGLSGSRSNLITQFVPTKGEASTYAVNESIQFRVGTRDPGYVTILALNPDGSANILTQNAYVQEGVTVFPRPGDQVTYNVAGIRGLQKVKVIFTRVRPTTDIVLGGVYTNGTWNNVTDQYLQPYALADRDVQETYLYIR